MRIVIDLQGAQTESRFRGIGRYSLSLALAIVRNRGEHEVIIALSGLFPDTIEPIRAAFDNLLSQQDIRVWQAPGPTREADPANHERREVGERLREAFLASQYPDVVLLTSLFEGFGDDAVTSVGILDSQIPVAVILYDLIPLISPDAHFRESMERQDYYARKIDSLKRSKFLLAISNSARQEAVRALGFDEDRIVNVSGACDTSFQTLDLTDLEKSSFCRKLGIVKPFVMYTGGADERKNLKRLVEAFAGLPEATRQKHQLVLVGKMPVGNISELTLAATNNGLTSSDLVFTGYVDDSELVMLYNSCALFVFPSLHEGFGIPPLEAMRCSAPVIAANATSLPEVIGLDDALFDPNSVASITAKIVHALTDDVFRARLIEQGLKQSKKFSWDDSAKRALVTIEKINPAAALARVSELNVDRTSIFLRHRKRILLIKLDHMGDFILAIPAMSKLKARFPYASIDIVIGSWNMPAAKSLKMFGNIYTYEFFKPKSAESPVIDETQLAELLNQLSEYDIAIDLRRQSDSRFLLVRTRAKQKVGYETFDAEINAKLDIAVPTHPDAPFVTTPLNKTSIAIQMVKLVDALPSDINDFVTFPVLGPRSSHGSTAIAIFPIAGNDVKEWDKSNYSALVELLGKNSRIQAVNVYFASKKEANQFDFTANAKLHIHIGLEFHALTNSVAKNAVCVANNSYGAHLGSYLGLVAIGIYGGHETVTEWAPVFGDSYVIHAASSCSPCHVATRSDCPYSLSCLTDIPVAFVYQKIVEALPAHQLASGAKQHFRSSPIATRKGPGAIVDQLIDSVANLSKEKTDPNWWTAVSTAIARNHPPRQQQRQLLVDISELVQVDARSGIQRVVRSILSELLSNSPTGIKVEPIYANADLKGYRYARQFTSNFVEYSGGELIDEPVDAYNGDIFLGLDLNQIVVFAQKEQLMDWHRCGVSIRFVVYDLLPVLQPHAFPDMARIMHQKWIETITNFDGALCISRAVAEELYQWLQSHGRMRERPFSIAWFHLGADVKNSAPTAGIPNDAGRILAALAMRPSFLMVGTLEPRKGHAQTLAAFDILWRDNADINLVIVGKQGWMVEAIVTKLRTHEEFGKRLFWLEGISDEYLEEIYDACTCLIAASEGEGFGLPLIEAAQHKLPIVARDIPVFREVAGEYAYFFKNDQAPDVLATAVGNWLVLFRAGAHPFSDAMPRLTWSLSAKQLLDAILASEPYRKWMLCKDRHASGIELGIPSRSGAHSA